MTAADVGNSYMHGFTMEKIYTVSGPEFGSWEGQVLICVISIYGLNTYMARWNEAFSYKIKLIVFRPSKAYPYLWMQDVGDHYYYITAALRVH